MSEFVDKVFIVTGAAGTLGQAIARRFGEAGANVVLVDRREDRLPALFPELVDHPNYHFATPVDLSNDQEVQAMVAAAVQRFGRIDGLINAAGGYRAGDPVHETSVDTLDFLLNLNARTAFIVSQAVVPELQKQETGKIVNVSAYAALTGKANMAPYIMSKSAVIRLTESMAEELRADNINVNCILPNVIDTPANRKASPNADYNHWVKPEAIADVVLTLCSSATKPVYGASIPVRGPC